MVAKAYLDIKKVFDQRLLLSAKEEAWRHWALDIPEPRKKKNVSRKKWLNFFSPFTARVLPPKTRKRAEDERIKMIKGGVAKSVHFEIDIRGTAWYQ